MALNQDQIAFIEEKCRQLGSIEKVKAFYSAKYAGKPSTVEKYAHHFATKLYKAQPIKRKSN